MIGFGKSQAFCAFLACVGETQTKMAQNLSPAIRSLLMVQQNDVSVLAVQWSYWLFDVKTILALVLSPQEPQLSPGRAGGRAFQL